MSRKRILLNTNDSADLYEEVYGDALLPLPWAFQVLQCSCEYDHSDGQALHIRRCTNLLTYEENQLGHTVCCQCRTTEDDIFQRAYHIAGLVQERVQERNITLTPRIHFGQYTVQLRDQLRTSGVAECCCTCTACSDPANPNREPISEDELEETANAVAEQDIADFVSGELPIPQRPRPTSRRRTS